MRKLAFGLFVGLGLAAAGPLHAHMPGGLEVRQAWSRPTPAGVPAAGYMTILNHGAKPQTLVRVETPSARQVEVHRTVSAGGIARMEAVPQLTIPPGGLVRLEPGKDHLMIVGLKGATRPGQAVPATLVFASGLKVRAHMTVGTSPPPPKPGSIHNH